MTDERLVWQIEYEKARFCLLVGVTPEFYDSLTVIEREAWTDAHNDIQKERSEAQS